MEKHKNMTYMLSATFFFLATVLMVIVVQAQKSDQNLGGVAKSGMSQGQALIAVRSDVKLSLKGTGGTTSKRVAALGEAAGQQMTALRQCYSRLVAQQPATVGRLRILVTFKDNNKRPALEVSERKGTDAALSDCVRDVLEKMTLKADDRPAAAFLTLDFDNSRAEGQAMLNSKLAESKEIEVSVDGNGKHTASWTTSNGKVTFTISAEPSVSKESVANILLGFKQSYAGYIDCRRRAGSRGDSPAGQTVAVLRIQRKGRVKADIQSCTIARKKGRVCMEKTLSKLVYKDVPANTQATVTVDFHE